jgi:tetratricopeptide (TPR) repeat protein
MSGATSEVQAAIKQAISLGETAPAVAAWSKILQEKPEHEVALAQLAQLINGPQREAAKTSLVALAEQHKTAQLWMTLAASLEDADLAAARGYYEKALEADPANAEAFAGLLQVLEALGDEQAIIDANLARTEHCSQEESVELLRSVAEKFFAKQDATAAYEVLIEALRSDATNERVALDLSKAAAQSNQWADLLTRFTKELTERGESPEALPLANTIARWYAALGQNDYAIAYHEFVLKRDPKDPEALFYLEELYAKTNRFPQRAEVLWKQFNNTQSTDEKRVAARKLAKVYESDLRNSTEAIRVYLALLELDPTDESALSALEALYRSEKAWEQLIDILSRRAQVTQDKALAAMQRRRIAEIYEVELQDINRAISAYKEALDLDPQDQETRQALEELLASNERYRDLLEIYDLRIESALDSEKIPQLRKKAELLEYKLRRPEEAALVYERILERAPTDEVAFNSLTQILANEEKWGDYAKTLRRRLEAAPPKDLALDLLRKLGDTFDQKLDNEVQAIEAYEELLGRSPDDLTALKALSRLYTNAKEWDRAMSTMRKLVDRLPDIKDRVEIYYKMGDIAHRELANIEQATKLYLFAIDVDPSYLPAVQALRKLYEERESYEDAARLLRQEENHTKDANDKAKLLTRLGDLYTKNLNDEKRSAEAYRQALTRNPRYVNAARPLADIVFAQEKYQEAEPLYDLLVEEIKVGREEARATGLHTLNHKLGICADKLGKQDKALKFLRVAYELDDKNPTLLYDLADALFRSGEVERSFSLYEDLLKNSSGEEEGQLVEIYYRMGAIRWTKKDATRSAEFFEKALQLNPRHRATLEAFCDVRRSEERYEEVVNLQRTRVEIARDPNERFSRLLELGELLRDKIKNPMKSIVAYQEAIEIRPEDRAALFQLMTLYHETKQWQRAIDTIQKIAALEKDSTKRARYHNTTAVILRDEMKNPEEARLFFEKALDDDPMYEYAFDSVKAILTARNDYKELERSYRKELNRLPKEGELAWLFTKLSHDLGIIYRDKLNNLAMAAEALEIAAGIEPGNIERHEILAGIYSQDPNRWDKAIEHHRILLQANPNAATSYQSLFKLYARSRQYDRAYCLAATLSFMRRAGQEEQNVLDHYRPKTIQRPTRRFDEELWRKLVVHPEQNPFIDLVFRMVGVPIAQLYAKPEKDFGFKKKERIDVATSELAVAKYFSHVQSTLGVAMPELHLRTTVEGFNLANAIAEKALQPVVVIGPDLFQNKTDKEIVFHLTRHLIFMRPDCYLARVTNLQAPTLQLAFISALKAAVPNLPVPKTDEMNIMRIVERLRPLLSGPQIAQLSQVAQKVNEGAEISMSKWLERLELTQNRAAFALCGDLEIAARAIQADAAPVGTLTPKDKLKDLVLYSVSDEYFALREAMGLQISRT